MHVELAVRTPAATALLPPNGTDQRLSLCSLATVPKLRRRSLLSCRLRQGHKQVSHPIKYGTLLWPPATAKNAKGHKSFTLHCSQHQSLSWNSPVSPENLWPQPAATLVWLKSPLSLFGSTASSSQGLEKPALMGDSSLQTREKGFSLEPGGLFPPVPSLVFNLCYIDPLKNKQSPFVLAPMP